MVTPNIILTPWQEELVRKGKGFISREQAARTPDPTGVSAANLQYNPSLGTDISGMSGADMLSQFGFGGQAAIVAANKENLRRSNLSEVDRLTEDIQADMAKNPDKYKAMPDSEAREQAQRQSIESLQAEIAANVAEQQRQAAQQQKLLDDLNLSAYRADTGQGTKTGPGAGRAAAGTADYTKPLPEGTGWWDETAAKVSFAERQAREINQIYGALLKENNLGPVTSLDEFINLVKAEASKSLETGGGMGILGTIYSHYFDGRDQWGIFGDPNLMDYTPPAGTKGPTAQSQWEDLFSANGQRIGYINPNGDMLDLQGNPVDPNDIAGFVSFLEGGQSPVYEARLPGFGFKIPKGGGTGSGMPMGMPLNFLDFLPETGYKTLFGTGALASYAGLDTWLNRNPDAPQPASVPPPATPAPKSTADTLTPEERAEIAKSGAGLYGLPDYDTVERFRAVAARMVESSTAEGLPVFPDLRQALHNDANWPVSDQYADMQSLYQTLVAGRQQGVATRATELAMINSVIDQAQEEQRLELQAEEAERNYDLARSALQLEVVKAMEEGRQFDQTLAFEEKQAAADLDRVNRQLQLQQQELGLQRYQTDVANPFNVAAMNLLSSSPATRAFSEAQQQNVDQGSLNTALQTAQFHSGRQGLGADDPQIQQMAARLVSQMTTPRSKAAMQAIAQGVSDITQMPQQQMGATIGTGGITEIPQIFNLPPDGSVATQQVQTQPVQQVQQQPATAGFNIPDPLQAIGMRIPQGASFGQPQSIQSFFPSGMPTVAQVADLPTMSQEVLASTGEATGTSREDLMRAAEAITPSTIGSPDSITQSTQRRLMPYRGRR